MCMSFSKMWKHSVGGAPQKQTLGGGFTRKCLVKEMFPGEINKGEAGWEEGEVKPRFDFWQIHMKSRFIPIPQGTLECKSHTSEFVSI